MYVNDIPRRGQLVSVSQYADDIAIWSTGTGLHMIHTQVQGQLDRLSDWCNRWRVRLNPAKTQTVLFSRARKKRIEPLSLLGEDLKFSKSAKFLGLTFDSGATWRDHIAQVRGRMWARVNALKAVCSPDQGLDVATGTHLYKQWIRPIGLYGSVAFLGASKSVLDKLEVTQNAALRAVLRAGRRTRTVELRNRTGMPTLIGHQLELAERGLDRIKEIPSVGKLIHEHRFYSTAKTTKHTSPLDKLMPHAPT